MATKEIKLQGIVRNQPDNNVPDGAMQELINLRPWDGALRPVGKKASVPSTPTDVRFIHVINETTKIYIGVAAGKINYWVYVNGELAATSATTVDAVAGMSFAALQNTLMISNEGSPSQATLVFDQQTLAYTEYTTLVPDMPFVSFQSVASSSHNETGGGTGTIWSGAPSGPASSYYEYAASYIKGLCSSLAARKRDLGYLIGKHFVRAAWELFDGTLVMHNIPDLQMLSTIQFSSEGRAEASAYYLDVVTQFTGKKLQYKLNISSNDLTALKAKYKGIIKSLNIYVTSGRAVKDIVLASFDNNLQYALKYDVASVPELNTWASQEFSYYKAASFTLDSLAASSYADIPLGNSNNLTTQPQMTSNNFSCHGVHPKRLYSYNQRVFMGSIKNVLYPGHSLNGFIYPLTTNYEGPAYEVCMVFYIDTSAGTKIVRSPWTVFNYYFEINDFSFGFHIPSVIGYPDARAKSCKLYIKDGSGTSRLLFNVKLISVPELNYSFQIGTGDIVADAGTSGLGYKGPFSGYPTETPPDVDNSYWDYNRVQATEFNNPFYLPAVNSYRIGSGEIIGLSTNAIALSQGQFGQFPLFCFTTEGIWAMNFGEGDPLIRTIVPLSREVCNNAGSITGVDGGVVFSTSKGLFVISGSKPFEISDQAEGKYTGWLSGSLQYDGVMNNPNVYQAKNYLCSVLFLTYLAGAKIAYDYKREEIIVSNSSYNYSWVFSMKYKTWFKISQVFTRFITDYPVVYGYNTVDATYTRFNMCEESYTVLTTVHMETRPLKIIPEVFKKINRFLLRGLVNDNTDFPFSLWLFGSTDGTKWFLLGNGNTFTSRTALLIGRSAFSCKYFIMVAGGKVDESTYFTDAYVDSTEKYSAKLR